MKKWIIVVIGCFFHALMFGQEKDLNVIASAGTTFETTGLSLDWTLGEIVVDYYDQPIAGISQGFHQPVYTLVGTNPIPNALGKISIRPSLFSDGFTVDMHLSKNILGSLSLINTSGVVLWTKSIEGNTIQEFCPGTSLLPGSYFLIIHMPNESILSTSKLLKFQ